MKRIWTSALAACLMAGSAMASCETSADRIQLRAQDGRVVAIVIGDDGTRNEFIADSIEILDAKEVRGTLSLRGDGSVSLLPKAASPRVRLGVTTETVPASVARQLSVDSTKALMVTSVARGLAAEKAGLAAYDVITKVDNVQPVTQRLLQTRVQECEAGETIKLRVIRQGNPIDINVIAETEVLVDAAVSPRLLPTETSVTLSEVPVRANVTMPMLPTLVHDESVSQLTNRHRVPLLVDIPVLDRYMEYQAYVDKDSLTAQLQAEINSLKAQMARIEALLKMMESE